MDTLVLYCLQCKITATLDFIILSQMYTSWYPTLGLFVLMTTLSQGLITWQKIQVFQMQGLSVYHYASLLSPSLPSPAPSLGGYKKGAIILLF